MVLADTPTMNNHRHHNNYSRCLRNNDNNQEILVKNFNEGETVFYSLALIRGFAPLSCSSIIIRGRKNLNTQWPIINGEFRILVELSRGINELELEAGRAKTKFTLIHEPRDTRLRVTPVYVICSGHDGYFQGPKEEDRSPESAATRIGLGARLLQCLTAEKLYEAGYGRKTFQLERDLDGPECLVMQSALNVDQARQMSQRELWEVIGRELMSGPLASKDRKYLAFLSCTRYQGSPHSRTHKDTLARTQGHAALGGGGLALFGSACLHTWPTSMAQVLPKFLDTKIIDAEHLMDDSNYRGTYGGCLATTLGSVLHELGHTFDLGHTREGIMGRGFDNIDRVFVGFSGVETNRNSVRRDPQHTTVALSRQLCVTVTIQDQSNFLISPKRGRLNSENSSRHLSPASSDNNFTTTIPGRLSAPASPELKRTFLKTVFNANFEPLGSQSDRTFWGTSCATLLAYHRWFNNCNEKISHREQSDIKYDVTRNLVRSHHGIRVIELREYSGGMVVSSRQFHGPRPPVETLVPPCSHNVIAALMLVVEDSAGNILKHFLPTAF